MSTPGAPARSPLIAVILSLAATGLGQIYCGRIVRGLVIFLGSLLFAPAVVVAALLPPATVVLVGLILALLTVLGVYVFAVVDAFRLARRGRDLFQSMDYNHPLVYALFILVGLTYSAAHCTSSAAASSRPLRFRRPARCRRCSPVIGFW